MREKLLAAQDVTVDLVKGHGGVFDITVDGRLKFSKHQLMRFPADEDLDAIISDG